MRVIYNAWGQMGNRLWQYVDQIAWAMKNDERVIALFWDPSLDDFDNLRNNPYIKFPFYIRRLQKGTVGYLYRRILFKLLHNDTMQRLFAKPFFQKHGFINGDDIMFSHSHYPGMWPTERELFSPSKPIVEKIGDAFRRFRQSHGGKIVGVHVRKGDYKDFYDGYYYYEDHEYTEFMRQMVGLLGDDTSFFFASNEKIDKTQFSEFRLFDAHCTKAVEDMYALSLCDYVMGPFSTFSGWASFYGQVPYYYFRRNARIAISDFQTVQVMTRPPR